MKALSGKCVKCVTVSGAAAPSSSSVSAAASSSVPAFAAAPSAASPSPPIVVHLEQMRKRDEEASSGKEVEEEIPVIGARVKIRNLAQFPQYNKHEGVVISQQGERVRVLLYTLPKELSVRVSSVQMMTHCPLVGEIALPATRKPSESDAPLCVSSAYSEAEIHCSECFKFNVAFPYPYLNCGRTKGNGKNHPEGSVARLFYEALDFMSHDMYEEAVAELSKLVEKHPRTKYAQCSLGELDSCELGVFRF